MKVRHVQPMRSIQIEIAGITLPITTERSDADVDAVKDLVNRHFRQVAEGARGLSHATQLAVAALTLAQELIDTRARLQHTSDVLDTSVHAIEATLKALHNGE